MELDEKQLTTLVVNTVREAISAKNAEDEMEALRTKNAELEEKLKGYEDKGEAENEAFEGKEDAKEEKEEKEIAAENMKPSQDVVKAFATAYNVDFGGKTPSFKTLGGLAGVTETDPVKLIAAVNTKFKEMQGTAQNTESRPASSVEVF